MTHHHKAYKGKPPIKEPDPPHSVDLLSLPTPLLHPDSAHVSLIYVPDIPQMAAEIHYAPTIAVNVSGNQHISSLAHALINTSASISIISPAMAAKLQLTPIHLDRPLEVTQKINDPFPVTSYVILEVVSLYKPEYRYCRPFYIADCSFYKVTLPTENVRRYTLAYGIQLSSLYIEDETQRSLDLIIGWDQFALTGLELVGVALSPKAEMNVIAYYTHFGYTLCGVEKVNMGQLEQQEEEEEEGGDALMEL